MAYEVALSSLHRCACIVRFWLVPDDTALKAECTKKGGDRDTQQDIAGGVAGGSPLRWGGRAPNVGGRLQRAGRLPLTYLHWVGPGHAVGDGPALALTQSWGRRRPWELLLSGLVLAVRGTGGPDELAQRRLREGGKQHLPTGISIRETIQTSGGESRAKQGDGKGEKRRG